MKINWKLRKQNIVFLAQLVASVLLPILAYMGMTVEDLTTWSILGDTLINAVKNPYVVMLVVANVWTALTDPTTPGFADSQSVLTRKSLK